MIFSRDNDGNACVEDLVQTYDGLLKCGMPKIDGFMHLSEENWPGSKEGLPCWCVLVVFPGENSGRWVPLHPRYEEQEVRAAALIDYGDVGL